MKLLSKRDNTMDVPYFALIAGIIAFSFFSFATPFDRYMTSDGAIHILMADELQLPRDLYYWGQDRIGSLTPMLAWPLAQLGIPADYAVGIVVYSILILGYLALIQLFDQKPTRLMVALFWFVPTYYMNRFPVMAHPYSVHMSLMVISCYLYQRSFSLTQRKSVVNLMLQGCALFLCYWVSDQSVVLVIIFAALLFYHAGSTRPFLTLPSKFKDLKHMLAFLVILTVGIGWVWFAKSSATVYRNYYNDEYLVSLPEFFDGLGLFLKWLVEKVTFQHDDFLLCLSSFLFFIIIAVAVIKGNVQWKSKQQRNIFWIFMANTVLTIGLNLVSKWVHNNDFGIRYFIIPYYSGVISLLILIDGCQLKIRKYLRLISAIALLLSVVSHVKMIYWNDTTSALEKTAEFKKFDQSGFIGGYWQAYMINAANPSGIRATPHGRDFVRNIPRAREVFKQKHLYLVKNEWFSEFPDTVIELGHLLIKKGDEFSVGDYIIAPYKVSKLKQWLGYPSGYYRGAQEKKDTLGRTFVALNDKAFTSDPFYESNTFWTNQSRYKLEIYFKQVEGVTHDVLRCEVSSVPNDCVFYDQEMETSHAQQEGDLEKMTIRFDARPMDRVKVKLYRKHAGTLHYYGLRILEE